MGTSELQRMRKARMQAYQQKHGGPCRRRNGHVACVCAVLTAPLVLAVAVLRRTMNAALAALGAALGLLLQPHFWCGVLAASVLLTCLAHQHCVVPPQAPLPPGSGR